MAVLPLAEWMPDRPDLAEATRYATGVIPITQDAYGPIRGLGEYSTNALNGPCRGFAGMEDISDQVQTFAGTLTDLFHMPYGSQTWLNASASLNGYDADGETWRIVQFKELVLATDYNDPIQVFTMGSSTTFSELSADAPLARHIAVAKNFVIVANTSDPVGGVNPARVWWCANGDPTTWPTPGSSPAQQTQSDYNDLVGPQGGVTGLAPNLAGCDCAIFFERGIFRMIYSGPPDVFDFYPAAAVKGCPAPNSIVPYDTYVYYLGEDGFYVFDGNQAVPIGAGKIDEWFFKNVNLTALNNVIGSVGVVNKCIFWLFQSVFATTPQPDMMILFRWDIQRWAMTPLNAQWIARIPIPFSTPNLPPAELPLVAGQLELGAIDPNNQLAFFSAGYLPAQIGTKAIQITPSAKSYVQSARPLIDGGLPAQPLLNENGTPLLNENGQVLMSESTAPLITIAMTARDTYQEVEYLGVSVGLDKMGECPQRCDGRYHRAVANITGGLWQFAYGIDLTAIRSGWR